MAPNTIAPNKHLSKKYLCDIFSQFLLLFPYYISKEKNEITKVHKTKEWKNQRTYQNNTVIHQLYINNHHCSISTLLNQNAKITTL